MSKYKTRKRAALLDYLSAHPDELLSVQDIAAALDTVSVSAVYRNLADLEAEGRVRRDGRTGTYRYTGGCGDCLHLSCTRCGRTFHMDGLEAERLVEAAARIDGFAVDRAETVLYGVCGDCGGRQNHGADCL